MKKKDATKNYCKIRDTYKQLRGSPTRYLYNFVSVCYQSLGGKLITA